MRAANSAPARQSSTVDLVAMLLVLAGDHQASANANAKTLLRLAEPGDRAQHLRSLVARVAHLAADPLE